MLDLDDPLVPVPLDLESYVHDALMMDSNANVDFLVNKYFTQFSIRMAGFDSVGNPIVPPNAHVLDHLARVWDLVDNETANNRPAANTVACPVDDDLECDLCGAPARYETPIEAEGERELIYACLKCTQLRGQSVLGGGASVYLMYDEEIPAEVRDTCDAIRTAQGLGSIWSRDTTDSDGQRSSEVEAALHARIEMLEVALRSELKEVRDCLKTLMEQFEIDANGNLDMTRSVYNECIRLATRIDKLKQALIVESEAGPSPDHVELITAREPATKSEAVLQQPRGPKLDATAVSVRLRHLWLNEVGPILEQYDHDLADEWPALVVRRVGSTLVISGAVDFGHGNTFDGFAGVQVRDLVRAESEGAVTSISYEYATNGIPKLRSKKTTSLDIYHPDDATAALPSELALGLAKQLTSVSAAASPALARVRVAGVGKFRTWLAVPTEEARRAIGSTAGAAADLKLAMNQLQQRDSVYDIVVDPETEDRYFPIVADGVAEQESPVTR